MSHFYDNISSKQVDVGTEMAKLRRLFLEEPQPYYGFSQSLEAFIDENFFRKLELSANYLKLQVFLADAMESAEDDKEAFLYYCEALLSVLFQTVGFEGFKRLPFGSREMFKASLESITKVIRYDLDKMCLKIKWIKDDGFGELAIIVPKDELLEGILQQDENKNIDDYLIEYRSFHNEGNIKRKEELLKLLAPHIEGITKTKKYRDLNERLFRNADFLLNNLDIRHNQKVKDIRFYNGTVGNREYWLDLTYRVALSVLNAKIEYSDNEAIGKKKDEVGLK